MNRVLLVNAGWGPLFSGRVRRYNRAFPPLDLLNCAAVLRQQGTDVALVDARVGDPMDPVLADEYDQYLVTLSPLDRWQCPNIDLEQIDRFLKPFPRNRTILMGAQATISPEYILERTGVSGLILGQPESSVSALAAGVLPGECAGTACLVDGGLQKAAEAPDLPLTDFPIPAFDMIDFGRYRYEVLGSEFGLLELTRGCPWSCHFCLLEMYGKKYRRKEPAQMVREIRAAWDHGMRCAYFQDLEFTLDHDLIGAFCDALLSDGPPLRWACQTRPDTVDAALLRQMRRAGCELIHYGVESGSERILASTGKRQTREAVEQGVALAHESGMRTLCYFLIGLPGERPSEMLETRQFAEQLAPTYASFQVATPYPGTPFYEEQSFDEPFPECFPGELTGTELRAMASRFTTRYHLRPGYLAKRALSTGRSGAWRELRLLASYLRPGSG